MTTEVTFQSGDAVPVRLREAPHRLVGTIEHGPEYGPSDLVNIGEVRLFGEVVSSEAEVASTGTEEVASAIEVIG